MEKTSRRPPAGGNLSLSQRLSPKPEVSRNDHSIRERTQKAKGQRFNANCRTSKVSPLPSIRINGPVIWTDNGLPFHLASSFV